MVEKKVVLVAGGTGFIGSHIANYFINKDFKVISISKNEVKPWRKIPEVKYIKHDLSQLVPKQIIEQISNIDYIINSSGYIDHRSFDDGGNVVFENNHDALANLTKLGSKFSIKTLVHLGSSDEYGPTSSPITEVTREMPSTPYSLSKVYSTNLLQYLFRTKDLPVVILRPFLVFGERQDKNRFLPYLIRNCLKSNNIPVTEGKQLRDYCDVNDFVNAVYLCIENKKAFGEVINIGSGVPISIRSVTNKVIEITGAGKATFGAIPYRDTEIMSLYPDITKARNLLGWEPVSEFNLSLERVINWYKVND